MVKSTSIIFKMKTAVVSFSTKNVHIVTTALETSSQDSIKKEQEKRGTSVYLSISISFIIFSDSIIVSQLQNSTFIFWTITKHCYGILHKKKKKKYYVREGTQSTCRSVNSWEKKLWSIKASKMKPKTCKIYLVYQYFKTSIHQKNIKAKGRRQ